MSTIKINELATSSISLTDFFAKADASGIATKNTMQGLSNFLAPISTLAYRGVLLSTDATVTEDGIYVAGDAGTYTNNGGLVITVNDKIVLISVTGTQTVFEKAEFPITLTIDAVATDGSTNAVQSNEVFDIKTALESADTTLQANIDKYTKGFVKDDNLLFNYQLENVIGSTPSENDVTNPQYFATFNVANSTKVGYQKSNCPTGFPSYKFNLGTSGASLSEVRFANVITNANILSQLRNQTVVFSFWVKHSTTINKLYIEKIINGSNVNVVSTKADNSKINEWYEVFETFTFADTAITSCNLFAFASQIVGTNTDIEFSSLCLKNTKTGEVFGFKESKVWEQSRNLIVDTIAKTTSIALINEKANEAIDAIPFVDYHNYMNNYQLESVIGTTPTNSDTTKPLYHLGYVTNGVDGGYQSSDCQTGFPSWKYTMGSNTGLVSLGLFYQRFQDLDLLKKISGKEVKLSFWMKHDATLSKMYLYRVNNGANNHWFTNRATAVLNTWYKVEFIFTLNSGLTSLDLGAYAEQSIGGGTVNVEYSSFSLELNDANAKDEVFTLNDSWERTRDISIATTPLNTKTIELIQEQINDDNIILSLPEKIYIADGNRLEIFKRSITNLINADNLYLNITCISGTARGNFYDRIYTYDATFGDGNMELQFTLQNEKLDIVATATTTIIPVAKKTSPVSPLNVLMITDSFGANTTYPVELLRRLTDTGGSPVADNLTNINFIGTSGTAPDRESRSGWTYQLFTGNTSPFWNPSTSQIDFDYYCTQNGYSQIDRVVILLGTNSMANNPDLVKLYDKLIAHNANIKGLVTGRIFPSMFGGTGSVSLSNGQTFYKDVTNVLGFNRRVEALLKESYSSNFQFCDLLPSFDMENNFPYSQVGANFRNQATLVKQGTDNVHPATTGYLQIADIFYSGFHSFLL